MKHKRRDVMAGIVTFVGAILAIPPVRALTASTSHDKSKVVRVVGLTEQEREDAQIGLSILSWYAKGRIKECKEKPDSLHEAGYDFTYESEMADSWEAISEKLKGA